jgi:hypothetical protein
MAAYTYANDITRPFHQPARAILYAARVANVFGSGFLLRAGVSPTPVSGRDIRYIAAGEELNSTLLPSFIFTPPHHPQSILIILFSVTSIHYPQ